jgi:hypothetical protein
VARRARGRRHDPAFCFNHRELPSEVACAACQERFCRHCVIEQDGKTLCGPCKNYRYKALARPPRVTGWAVAAVILALVAAAIVSPIALALATTGANPAILLAVVVTPQLVAVLLAALGLHRTATDPRVAGQSLAITALVAAVVSSLTLGALTMLSLVQWV